MGWGDAAAVRQTTATRREFMAASLAAIVGQSQSRCNEPAGLGGWGCRSGWVEVAFFGDEGPGRDDGRRVGVRQSGVGQIEDVEAAGAGRRFWLRGSRCRRWGPGDEGWCRSSRTSAAAWVFAEPSSGGGGRSLPVVESGGMLVRQHVAAFRSLVPPITRRWWLGVSVSTAKCTGPHRGR